MSCNPLIQRAVDAAARPVLKHIHDRLEQFAGDWNRQFPGVIARTVTVPQQGIHQMAGELGRLIGHTIRPLLPPMRMPVAVQE